MNLAEFRAKNPAYKDWSDDDLAYGLHQKYYSDWDFDEFSREIGYTPEDDATQRDTAPVRESTDGDGDLKLFSRRTAGRMAQAVGAGVRSSIEGAVKLDQRATKGNEPTSPGPYIEQLRAKSESMRKKDPEIEGRRDTAMEGLKEARAQQLERVTKLVEKLPEEVEGPSSGIVEDAAVSFAQSGVGMVTSVVSPMAGSGVFFTQFYNDKDRELLEQGVDEETRHNAALIRAALGTVAEQTGNLIQFRALGSVFSKVASKAGITGKLKKYLGAIFGGAAGESLDEYADAYANLAADVYAENPEADLPHLVGEFTRRASDGEFQKEALYGAAVGGIAGTFLPGAGIAVKLPFDAKKAMDAVRDKRQDKSDAKFADENLPRDERAVREAGQIGANLDEVTGLQLDDDAAPKTETAQSPTSFSSGVDAGKAEVVKREKVREEQKRKLRAEAAAERRRTAEDRQREIDARMAEEQRLQDQRAARAEQLRAEDLAAAERDRTDAFLDMTSTQPGLLVAAKKVAHTLSQSDVKEFRPVAKTLSEAHKALTIGEDNIKKLRSIQYEVQNIRSGRPVIRKTQGQAQGTVTQEVPHVGANPRMQILTERLSEILEQRIGAVEYQQRKAALEKAGTTNSKAAAREIGARGDRTLTSKAKLQHQAQKRSQGLKRVETQRADLKKAQTKTADRIKGVRKKRESQLAQSLENVRAKGLAVSQSRKVEEQLATAAGPNTQQVQQQVRERADATQSRTAATRLALESNRRLRLGEPVPKATPITQQEFLTEAAAKRAIESQEDPLSHRPVKDKGGTWKVVEKPRGDWGKQRFAKAKKALKPKSTPDKVAAQVKALDDVSSSKALKSVVVRSADKLPDHIRKSVGKTDSVEAVYDPDSKRVYFVADNISSEKRAIQVWLHEQVGHHGLRFLFDEKKVDFDQFLDKVWRDIFANKRQQKLVEQVRQDYAHELKGLSEKEQKLLIVEEIVARRAEQLNPFYRKRVYQRFLDWINNFIKAVTGYKGTTAPKMTMKDLDVLLETAKNRIMHDNVRDWLEFKHDHETYMAWAEEVARDNPETLDWYDAHKTWTSQVLGDDAKLFDILLGLTSAGSKVQANVVFAAKAYLYLAGKLDKIGGRFPGAVEKALKMARDKGEFSSLYKVDEFVRGLLGDEKATTNDMWMRRLLFGPFPLNTTKVKAVQVSNFLNRMEYHFAGKGTGKENNISSLDSQFYPVENTAARHKIFELARDLTDKTGKKWTPRSVQAALWMKMVSDTTGVPLSEMRYDYGEVFTMYESPTLDGMTPKEYIESHMSMDEIGTVHKKTGIKGYTPISKLEKLYQNHLRDNGVEAIDKYSTEPGENLGMGVHFRTVDLKKGDFLVGIPADANPNDIPSYNQRDVYNRIMDGMNSKVAPYQPLVYFYEAGTQPEGELQTKKRTYNVDFGKAKIYNAITDGLGLWDKARSMVMAEAKRQAAASAKRMGLKPKQVPVTPPTSTKMSNAIATLIKDAGYDGFVTTAPTGGRRAEKGPGRWILMFERAAIDHVTIDAKVGVSDVVESMEKGLPRTVAEAGRTMQERAAAFKRRVQKIKEHYKEVKLEGFDPAVARFGEATSGQVEVSSMLSLRGTVPAMKAMLAEIGISNSQRQIYLMHNQGTPNGTMVEFPIARDYMDFAKLSKAMKDAGLNEFNIVTNEYGSRAIQQFVFDGDTQTLDLLAKVYDTVGDRNRGQRKVSPVNSEVLGDTNFDMNPDSALNGFKQDPINYFGKEKGEQIYEEAIQARRERESRIQAVADQAGTVQGKVSTNRGGTTGGLGTSNNSKYASDGTRIRLSRHIHYSDKPTIGNAIKGFVDRAFDFGRNLTQELSDYQASIREMEKGQDIPAALSGYKSLRLMSSTPSIMGTVMHEGMPVYDTETHWIKVERDGTDGILAPFVGMSEQEMETVQNRLLALSVKELMDKKAGQPDLVKKLYGKDENGEWIDPAAYTAEIMAETQDWYDANQKKFKDIQSHLKRYNEAILGFADKAGILDPEYKDIWKRANYIPLNRIHDVFDNGILEGGAPKGKDGTVRGVKQLKGGQGNVADPLQNLLLNYSYLINESLKNISYKKVFRSFAGTGIINHEKISAAMAAKKKNVITIKVKGKSQYYTVSDADVFNALTDINNDGLNVALFQMAKKALTWGVTLSPAFRVRNFIRDTAHTWVLKGSANPVSVVSHIAKALKAGFDVLAEHPDMVELRSRGGAFTGGYYGADNPKDMAKTIHQSLKPKSIWGAAWRGWEKIGEAAENANRLALYRDYIKRGEGKMEAAFQAKDLLDFSMHGKSGTIQAMIKWIPFLNARIQGLTKLAREGRLKQGMITRGMLLAGASLLLHAWNSDQNEEEYKKLTTTQKWNEYHFWLGGQHFKLPMPFEIGAIFSALPVQLVDTLSEDTTHGGKELADFIKHMFLQTFSIMPGGATREIVEQMGNVDFFYDRPIVDRSLAGVEPAEQWDERSSKAARKIGKMVGWSPKRIDHAVKGVFGFAGSAAMTIVDTVMLPFQEGPVDPALTVNEMYWLPSALMRRAPAKYTRLEEQFYDVLREADKVANTYRVYRNRGDKETAREYRSSHRDLLKLHKRVQRVNRQLQDIAKRERRVFHDTDMTSREKRDALDELIVKRQKIIERALRKLK